MIEAKVFSEVYTIINQLEKCSVKKIPKKLLNKIREKAINKVEYIDINVSLEDLDLQKETKEMLAIISYYYFCNDEERSKWDKVLIDNEKIYRENLNKKYNLEIIFNPKQKFSSIKTDKEKYNKNKTSKTEYKEKFIKKLIKEFKFFLNNLIK